MKIHHNTLKKAKAHGLIVEWSEPDNVFVVSKDGDPVVEAKDPKDALDLAILELSGGGVGTTKPKPTTRKAKKAEAPRKRADDEDESENGDDEGDASRSVVKAKYRARYLPNKGHCGDDLAKKLRDAFMTEKDEDTGKPRLDFEAFVEFAKANGVWVEGYRRLKDRHGNRNDGLIRMNCANRLRAKVRRDKHKIVW